MSQPIDPRKLPYEVFRMALEVVNNKVLLEALRHMGYELVKVRRKRK